jgi:hypothetical protein
MSTSVLAYSTATASATVATGTFNGAMYRDRRLIAIVNVKQTIVYVPFVLRCNASRVGLLGEVMRRCNAYTASVTTRSDRAGWMVVAWSGAAALCTSVRMEPGPWSARLVPSRQRSRPRQGVLRSVLTPSDYYQ